MTTTNPSNYTSSSFDLTGTAQEILPYNQKRSGLILFNIGTGVARWYFEDNADMYFEMAAGTGIHFSEPPQNQIKALSSTTSTITVMEA